VAPDDRTGDQKVTGADKAFRKKGVAVYRKLFAGSAVRS